MLPRASQRRASRDRSRRISKAQAVEPHWAGMLPAAQWETYLKAIQALRAKGVRFLVGGGFALANYTERWRNTKDMDFYVLPDQRQAAMHGLAEAGFEDYYSKRPYDRGWIYRSTSGGVIVDVIWSMANRRAAVDEEWFQRAPILKLRSEALRVLPVEELFWAKLYVLQHDHCDWPDVLNLLYARGATLDWKHLLKRLDRDILLLKALATLFDWLCPDHSDAIPKSIRTKLKLSKPAAKAQNYHFDRVKLLDSREWFAAMLPKEKQLEI